MGNIEAKAVIGTNSWGAKVLGPDMFRFAVLKKRR